MIYNKYVEIGRVAYIAKGKDVGKLAVIVNVVDGNRVLLDGPVSGVKRGVRNFKDLHLTKFKVPLHVGQRTKHVQKSYEAEDIAGKWQNSQWAKKLAMRQLRSSLNDFERFKESKREDINFD
ncbi:ribosomal protein l14 domain-containing protein [Ditylenchus destructor]|nr:ribosomal protein l14 domain-containing protein [Ditylenchus destructor]